MTPPPRLPHPPQYLSVASCFVWTQKKAPHAWFEHFSSAIFNIGYSQSFHNTALFYFSTKHSYLLLLFYVDDIITGNDLKIFLSPQFDMQDLGPLCYFSGIEVAYSL